MHRRDRRPNRSRALRDCIGENNHLTPGKGEIDFKAVLLELDRVGYAGDLIFELEGEESKSAAEELANNG
jgi:sugar phosphate isomerase/epimerase